MKQSTIFFLVFATMLNNGFSQTMQNQIEKVGAHLGKVSTVKYIAEHSLSIHEEYIVDIEQTQTSSNGKATTKTFRVNLADIHENGIARVIESSLMKVEIPTTNQYKFISENKDGKIKYINKIKIDVNDSDEAEAFITDLKTAVATAKDEENKKFNHKTLEGVLGRLPEEVKTVGTLGKQTLSLVPEKKAKFVLSVVSEKGVQLDYEFNLKDLNKSLFKFKVRGDAFSVDLGANAKQKVIKVSENGLTKKFVSNVVITAQDPNNGKTILRLFEMGLDFIKNAE